MSRMNGYDKWLMSGYDDHADYAISISRGKTEWEDAKEFLGHMVWITPCLGLVVYFIYAYLTNQ